MSGRPLRFLGCAAIGWVAVRATMLWPTAGVTAAIPQLLVPAAQAVPIATTDAAARPIIRPLSFTPVAAARADQSPAVAAVGRRMPILAQPVSLLPSNAASPVSLPVSDERPIVPFTTPLPGRASPPGRWSGSAWLVVRDGQGIAPGLGGGQLGGAQGGARLAYAIDGARRVAMVARITSPLQGHGREASIGVEWRPTGLPVRLVIEHRFAIDGGTGGPAAGIIAGTGPAPLAFGFDLETYGQAGVIHRERTEAFADGAARLTRPLAKAGGVKLDIGAGAWGGAQRDAQRLDLGPTIGVRVPVGGHSLRATLDWRQRFAGHARPGSGPALTIGTDF